MLEHTVVTCYGTWVLLYMRVPFAGPQNSTVPLEKEPKGDPNLENYLHGFLKESSNKRTLTIPKIQNCQCVHMDPYRNP